MKSVTVYIVSSSICDEVMCKRKKKCEEQELPEALARASGQIRSQQTLWREFFNWHGALALPKCTSK